jgi:hypothetical protein
VKTGFAMTRTGDNVPYRGIEFEIEEAGGGIWQWAYYPKIGSGGVARGQVRATRETAIAVCKAAIDNWLGPDIARS